MTVFLTLTLSILSIAGIVVLLRRQQSRDNAEQADRHQPLPPLGEEERQRVAGLTEDEPSQQPPPLSALAPIDGTTSDPEDGKDVPLPEQDGEPEFRLEAESRHEPELEPETEPKSESEPEPKPEPVPEPESEPEPDKPAQAAPMPSTRDASSNRSKHWLDECQELKNRGELEAALQLCQKMYPQMQAFEQQAIIRRTQIREARKNGDPQDKLLTALYQTATQASCLHDRVKELPNPPANRKLAKLLPRERLEALDMPYHSIGYRSLRLLTRTDQKWLVKAWGEPEQHQSARLHHAALWHELSGNAAGSPR